MLLRNSDTHLPDCTIKRCDNLKSHFGISFSFLQVILFCSLLQVIFFGLQVIAFCFLLKVISFSSLLQVISFFSLQATAFFSFLK